MAISFVTSGSNGQNNGGSPAITLGATPAANDLILVIHGIGDNDSTNVAMAMTTAGYTLITGGERFDDSGTYDLNVAVWYKFANGTENTLTCTGAGGVDAANAAVAMVFRGVNTTTPFDVTPTSDTNLAGFTPDPPSIDWTTTGTAVVCAVASCHQVHPGTYTAPTGYTTNAVQTNADDTTDVTVGMGYNLSPADPENPGAWAHTGTDAAGYAGTGFTIALRPAAGGTTKNLSYSHVGTATALKSVGKPRAYSHVGAATETKTVNLVAKAYSHVGTLVTTALRVFLKSISFSHVGQLATRKSVGLIRAFSHVATLVTAKALALTRSIAYSHVGTATVRKAVSLVAKAYSHVGSLVTSKSLMLGLSKAYSHIGTLSQSRAATFLKSLAYSAVHTLTKVTQFIPDPGVGSAFRRFLRSFGFGIGLNK